MAKRPILVLLIAIFVFGGLSAYASFLKSLPKNEHQVAELPSSTDSYVVEVTLSFVAERDVFALNEAFSLELRMAGQPLLKRSDKLEAGKTIEVKDISGVVAGNNAIFVRAVPSEKFISQACAARVIVLHNGHSIEDRTIWSSPGDVVAGEVIFVAPSVAESSHDQEHRE